MSVLPVAAVTAVTPTTATSALSGVAGLTGASATSGADFSSVLGSSLDSLQSLQSNTDSLAVKAVTGGLDDVHDYTIAAAKSSTAMELTAAVRNKAVEAFQSIMAMQA